MLDDLDGTPHNPVKDLARSKAGLPAAAIVIGVLVGVSLLTRAGIDLLIYLVVAAVAYAAGRWHR